MAPRRRADTLLAERGLAASRSAAAASVRAGRVRLGTDGPSVAKPGQMLPEDADLVVEGGPEFVSRGGVKLANALNALPVAVAGREALDVGASTGGFTDCLLARGAARVIALDVGYGQLDWSLREDARVTVMERVNARHLEDEELPFRPSLVTVDVSFISLSELLGPIAAVADEDLDLLAMVKPQFELGPELVGRGGVVRDPEHRRAAIRLVAAAAEGIGLVVRGLASSGLPGPKGNRESFLWLARRGRRADLEAELSEVEP
ncbi:MAG TPA: TlyA family RNA methyltransferase [Solirubrobacterales bacterium]|jgi:23S rRNA (cytidine1920-2'-O)/16S rRNA (cytidine1409-2'-O)-methyltransferase|nr:TlyA family RNA methyltransferase [Solirubrobacterales bacterium]